MLRYAGAKMLNDDQKRRLREYWSLHGDDLPGPEDERDWALIEFGVWFAKIKPPRRNSPDLDRERVSLLIARRARDTKKSVSETFGDLNGEIRYVSGSRKGEEISYETLSDWAKRRKQGFRTPQQHLDNEYWDLFPAWSSIDEDINQWEALNDMPINTGLPEGW